MTVYDHLEHALYANACGTMTNKETKRACKEVGYSVDLRHTSHIVECIREHDGRILEVEI